MVVFRFYQHQEQGQCPEGRPAGGQQLLLQKNQRAVSRGYDAGGDADGAAEDFPAQLPGQQAAEAAQQGLDQLGADDGTVTEKIDQRKENGIKRRLPEEIAVVVDAVARRCVSGHGIVNIGVDNRHGKRGGVRALKKINKPNGQGQQKNGGADRHIVSGQALHQQLNDHSYILLLSV